MKNLPRHLRAFAFLVTALGILGVSHAHAAAFFVKQISYLGNHGEKEVIVNGVAGFIINAKEFTLMDKTGRIEVNLQEAYPNLQPGDSVTIQGHFDDLSVDEILKATILDHRR